jgi:hypothetical protein
MSEKPDRHTRFISDLSDLLERHNALLDTPGPEGMSAVHVVYTDVPINEMDLYPLFTETGEFYQEPPEVIEAKAATPTGATILNLMQREADLVAALEDCIEQLSDVSVFGRGMIEKTMHEEIDETVKSAQELLGKGIPAPGLPTFLKKDI